MEIDRRSLLKKVVAGGTLLAWGVPPWAMSALAVGRPGRKGLLLGGTGIEVEFARGAASAGADQKSQWREKEVFHVRVLMETDRVETLLRQFPDSRWMAVMDDAGAMVLVELIRAVGGRLLCMGTHVYEGERSGLSRHVLVTSHSTIGVAGVLASELLQRRKSFSITEDFLREAPKDAEVTAWTAPGVSSYRFALSPSFHLHCSGVSWSGGCERLGLTVADGVPPRPVAGLRQDTAGGRSANWAEAVGYAMGSAALGAAVVQESCTSRGFVHQGTTEGVGEPAGRFMSLVFDI